MVHRIMVTIQIVTVLLMIQMITVHQIMIMNYSEGHSYDKSDPFYSANDVDGNGKLTDEEWQNAMDDAITYYYYKMQEEN